MRWLGAAPTLLLGCACMVQHEVGDLELPAEPGLPSAIAPLTVSVAPGYVVDCMATLVHPLWALTTAHCFASAPPESWVLIRDFGTSAQVRDVIVHEQAVNRDATEGGAFEVTDVVAAHDLALVPLDHPMDSNRVAALWRPESEAELAELEHALLRYGRHVSGEAVTETAVVTGLVPSSELLGGEREGELLSARGKIPRAGDSGGGGLLVLGEMDAAEELRLAGVVQNAPESGDRGVFGLVPLWVEAHLDFIDLWTAEPQP